MEDKKIKEFNKIYLDTIQHSKNIKKWIDASSRKKGDLNKSMKRLESKYNKLFALKNQLEREGISVETILGKASRNNSVDDYKTLIKDMKKLYSSTKTAIPSNLIQEERKYTSPTKEIDYTGDINYENGDEYIRSYEYNYYSGYYQKPPFLYRLRWRLGNFVEKSKEFLEKSRKVIIRTTSMVLVSAIALAGGISAGESNSEKTKKDDNSILYTTTTTDSNKTNNIIETTYTEFATHNQATPDSIPQEQLSINSTENAKKAIKIQEPTESTEKVATKQVINENTKTPKQDKLEIGNGTYIVKANTKYTEVSDGTGNWGTFSQDTKVKVYNRALVRTDNNGNKQILEVSKIGQTWQEFAKENDMNYQDFENYIKNNNIEKCVSLESDDGTHSYGWVSEKALEKVPEKDIELSR